MQGVIRRARVHVEAAAMQNAEQQPLEAGGIQLERLTDLHKQKLTQSLKRVGDEFEAGALSRPANLGTFLRILDHPRYKWTQEYDDAMVILKGYFVWSSHIVQPTKEEVVMMQGYPAVRSGGIDMLEGHDMTGRWHVAGPVTIGDEQFHVERGGHYLEPELWLR